MLYCARLKLTNAREGSSFLRVRLDALFGKRRGRGRPREETPVEVEASCVWRMPHDQGGLPEPGLLGLQCQGRLYRKAPGSRENSVVQQSEAEAAVQRGAQEPTRALPHARRRETARASVSANSRITALKLWGGLPSLGLSQGFVGHTFFGFWLSGSWLPPGESGPNFGSQWVTALILRYASI